MEKFEGIKDSKIDVTNGVPRLMINGKPVVPLIYFHNTHINEETHDITGTVTESFMKKQVALARDGDVHIYSLPFGWPVGKDGVNPDPETANGVLDKFIAIDPQAIFILRLYPGSRDWGAQRNIPEDDIALFQDGTKGIVSIASDYFWQPTNEVLSRFIRYYEESPYGPRILSYHPGGPDSEMFHQGFWNKGPDYSVANHRGFRRWLKAKYQNDEALRKAWGRANVTIETAPIPMSAPGRYPMNCDSDAEGALTQILYAIPQERDWVDFSTYENDIVGDRVIDWAKVIKQETKGKKLSMFFYGYIFELHSSFAGHYALQRVLECPDVDVLAGPNSYFNRFNGGTMNFMCPVDSLTSHGKLWLNEDDMRTSLVDLSVLPPEWAASPFCKNLDETLNLLDRNFASMMVHRAGTWWMDLLAAGAYNHPAVWELIKERKTLYEKVYQAPTPFRGEVAVIADGTSKNNVRDDWATNFWTMVTMRDEAARSGATIAYHTLEDFIQGSKVPSHKIYVFANAFSLTDEQIDAIRARLDREKATAYWAYAPGYIGPEGMSIERSTRLTGIQLAVKDGTQGSEGLGALAGESWGAASNQTQKPMTTSPRLIVTDEKAESLGRYKADALTSAARTKTGAHTSIFVGDMGVQSQMLMRLFEAAGAHIYTRDSSYVQTDGQYLMIHSGKSGLKPITLPEGTKATAIKGEIAKSENNTIFVNFKEGETLWFQLTGKEK